MTDERYLPFPPFPWSTDKLVTRARMKRIQVRVSVNNRCDARKPKQRPFPTKGEVQRPRILSRHTGPPMALDARSQGV